MADQVTYNWQEMESIATTLSTFAGQIDDLNKNAQQKVQNMSSYAGASRQAFEEQVAGWKKNADSLKGNLVELSGMLKKAAQIARDTEQNLTNTFKGNG